MNLVTLYKILTFIFKKNQFNLFIIIIITIQNNWRKNRLIFLIEKKIKNHLTAGFMDQS